MPATLMSRSGFDNLKFLITDATKICYDKILSFGFIEAILVLSAGWKSIIRVGGWISV